MILETLPKSTTKAKKRLGRGYGSGKGGHTVGRGVKGQKARNRVKLWFEGGQLPLTKRLPFQRGKGRFKALKKDPLIVDLKYLSVFAKNSLVTLDSLIQHQIVREKEARAHGVKLLGNFEVKHPLTIAVPISKQAAKLVASAGGTVVTEKKPLVSQASKPTKPEKVTAKPKAKPIPKPTKNQPTKTRATTQK